MRNIFLFIRQFFNLITFVILQIICIVTLTRYSRTHQAFFYAQANEVTGKINSKYNNFNKYFTLSEVNKQLALENANLRDSLKSNFIVRDTTVIFKTDTALKDTSNHYRKYTFLPAVVVGNTVSQELNFIQLERGALQGVKKDMGVLGPLGIVGKVVSVSDNYCMVMSLLNRVNKVSAMFKKSITTEHYSTNVYWDGNNINFLTMDNVSKSISVKKGDTIVTSNYSPSFPSNLMIGTVAEIGKDAVGNNYKLKIKTATNFNTLQHVYIIANSSYDEQNTLDTATVKKYKKLVE